MRIEDRKTTTDRKFDFESLPRWENHNSAHYAYDERLQALCEKIIKVDEVKWYSWAKLNQLPKMIYKKSIWSWFN